MARALLALVALCALGAAATAQKVSTDRLVAEVQKANLHAINQELMAKGIDVNTPDSSRRLPLVEAVRTRDPRVVLALLEHGALAKAVDPASGSTPLALALQANSLPIARALLAHGADPAAKDRSGVPARSAAVSSGASELLSLYDAKGAMGFEAAPGAWLKADKKGETYYWNPSTGESRWTAPPSCAWQRVTVQGHPVSYINTMTGQKLTSVPPALAWARVTAADGTELWLNWAARVSSATIPAELPADLAAELARTANARWYNAATGEFAYTDPKYSTAWRELADEVKGAPYFFHVETGETVWTAPEELAWTAMTDADGASFFHNTKTGAVAWTAPADSPLAFVRDL
ncbi:hypothetical protein HYH03_018526 [Edaphochlamys debaryana]|uniref:WW domain-containing protein n=1 Tax=Edaphochlamys debaryana TaxID=47281 RepID=A0A835XFT8_9CHLO|nr:hypothetical protein HYH03_018526 [Edaphochlamys debaryana]|eukprot:KAG2482535.1 hypothetical protein HYH03_018526 [Edaphochlamys debaryana]